MNKKTYVIFFIVIVIVIGVLLFMAFKNPSDKNKKGEMCPDGKTPVPSDGKCPQESVGTNAVADPITGCVQPSSYINFKYPIKFGMKDGGNVYENKQVSVLQKKLNIIYKTALKEDGYYGCNTQEVVKEKLGVTEVGYQNPIWTAKPILG